MGYRKAYYKKDGTYVQGHFTNTRSKFSNKNNGCLLMLIILFSLAISCSESSDSASETSNTTNSSCPTKTCGDFSTQTQAQATYNSNKKCYKILDSDGDGIACENLSK
jgi:hypothetical protein